MIIINQEYNVKYVLFFLLIIIHINVWSESLESASDIWSPFFMVKNKQYSGIGVEILSEVVKRTGDNVNYRNVPNKRAIVMFEEKEIDIIVLDSTLWNDPKKADVMAFSTDVMSVQEYVYFLPEKYIQAHVAEDFIGRKINIFTGYYYPDFDPLFKDGRIDLYEVSSEASLVRSLVQKRADAIFMDSFAFKKTIYKLGYDQDKFKRGMQLSDTILCIKVIKEKSHLIKKFNNAIFDMKNDGTIKRIINKYTLY